MKTQNSRSNRRFHIARLVVCLSMVLMVLGAMPTQGQALGIISHAKVVDMAIERLAAAGGEYQRVGEHVKTYRSDAHLGAMFPDISGVLNAVYVGITPPFDGWGEFIHDTADVYSRISKKIRMNPIILDFRAALMREILPLYRHPTSDDDRKEIAFLFGLICHQEADVRWHFPPPPAGQYSEHPVPDGFLAHKNAALDFDKHRTMELGTDRYIFNSGTL